MVALIIRVEDVPQVWWPLRAFVRMASFVEAARDVLTEAHRLAGAARERYPLAD
jgi:hypothetical protein